MSCYQAASAVLQSGTTGFLLVVKVKVFAGIIPPTLEKGDPPYEPENVFPVTIVRSVPASPTQVELEVTHNVESEDQFAYVEIFCGDTTPGTRIPITKE
jgi:hypothetical protein